MYYVSFLGTHEGFRNEDMASKIMSTPMKEKVDFSAMRLQIAQFDPF